MKLVSKFLFPILTICFLAFGLNAQNVPGVISSNGLEAYYPLDGNGLDLSGNGNHGDTNYVVLDTNRFGQIGKALRFNGYSSNILIPNAFDGINNITISAWYKTSVSNVFQNIMTKSGDSLGQGASNEAFTMRLNLAQVKRNSMCQAASGWQGSSAHQFNLNTWTHYVFSYDGDSLRVYIDAQLVSTVNVTDGNIDNCSPSGVKIGMHWTGDTQFFNGSIDDIGVWNRALSHQEINDIYNYCPTSASINLDSNVTCSGVGDGGATAIGTGGSHPYSFSWSNSATTSSITGVLAGTYSVTLTDANGCTDSSSIFISEPVALVSTSTVDSNVSCNGLSDGGASSSSSGGVGPYSFNWSNSATTSSISGVMAGTYSVTLTDANGCTDSSSIVISEPVALISSSIVDSNVSCNGLSDGGASSYGNGGSGPYSFNWSNGAATSSISGVTAGTYSVTLTDANGCTDSSFVLIAEPVILDAQILVDSNVACHLDSTGGLSSAVSGGVPFFSYLWSNGDTSSSIVNIPAGSYYLTITDANGCSDSDSALVSQPPHLQVVVENNTIACHGDSTGYVSAHQRITGGVGPYKYDWSTGSKADSIHSLIAGVYSLTVTDANGCSSSITVSVPQNDIIELVETIQNSTCDNTMDGSINTAVTGGQRPYSYTWSNSSSTSSINGLNPGVYSVQVMDDLGCIHADSFVVGYISSSPKPNLGNDTAYGVPSLITLYSGEVGNHIWSTGSAADTISFIFTSDTAIWVTITNENGCIGSDTISLNALLSSMNTSGSSLIQVYPNPSNGEMNIKVEGLNSPDFEVHLIDMNGKVMYSKNYYSRAGSIVNFDVYGIAKGGYVLKIIADSTVFMKKVIIR